MTPASTNGAQSGQITQNAIIPPTTMKLSPTNSTRPSSLVACGLALAVALIPVATNAADWLNNGPSTDWNTGANWNGSVVPNNDGASITTSTGNIATISASPAGTITELQVGTWGNTGRLDHTAGSLSITNTNWPYGWLLLGGGSNGTGTYNLADTAASGGTFTGFGTGSGGLSVNGEMRVGAGAWWDHATGVLNVNTSGTVQINGSLVAGSNIGDVGTVNIDAGTVTVAGDYANSGQFGHGGSAATGNLNISGGSISFNNRLALAVGTGSSAGGNVATVTMSGGTLTTDATHDEDWHAGVNMASGYNTATGGSATFNLNGGTLSTLRVFSETGDTGVKGTSTFNFNGGTLQAQASRGNFMEGLTRANVRNGGAVVNTNGFNVTIAQALLHSDIGGDLAIDGGLTKNGAGTLTLSNANTYSGGTTVSAGRIEVTNNTALGSGAVSIAAGANVLLNANSLTIANDFTLNGTTSGGALVSGDRPGGNVTTLSGTIILAASSNIASWWNDKQLTLSGKITGSGSLTFDRATALGDPVGGKFLISGATNDYTGSTTVNGKSGGNAILQLGAANALPTGTTLTLNDANLSLLGFNQTLGGLVASTTTSQIVNGNATAVTLTVNNAAANTFASVLGGFGTDENNFALTKGGAGTLTLSGANTYTGATTISAGTLQLGDGGTTGTLSTSSTIMNNGTFTINRSDAVAQGTDFSGSVITGTGGLTQTGAGVTTLTVANTYSGATTVSAGTLLANNTTGSATGSGNVTVQTGARLGGSGLVGLVTGTQNITVNSGGFLGIGNTGDIVGDDLGLLTSGVGVITFNGTLEFDIYDNFGGTANLSNPLDTNDLLNLTSDTSIVLSGTLKVTDLTGFSDTLWEVGDTWRLLDWSNVTAGPKFSGGFTTLDLPDLDAGLDWLASTDGSGFYIAVIVVPEPSRAVLLLAGFMVLVLRRRPLVNG